METSLIIISLCLLLSLILILLSIFYSKNEKLKEELNTIKLKNSEMEKFNDDLMLIEPGDKVIYPDYYLRHSPDKKDSSKDVSFNVTYELEVLDVSENKIKVKGIDFTSSFARDPTKKAGILEFIKDKWVDKKDVQLVVDDSIKRDIKLRKLGIT